MSKASGHVMHEWVVSDFDVRYQVCSRKIVVGAKILPCPARTLNPDRPRAELPPPSEPSGYKATSRTAFVETRPQTSEVRARILDLFRAHGPMTDEEMFERYTANYGGGYRNTILPARNALYKDELVYSTQTRRTVRSGRTAIVWAAK